MIIVRDGGWKYGKVDQKIRQSCYFNESQMDPWKNVSNPLNQIVEEEWQNFVRIKSTKLTNDSGS